MKNLARKPLNSISRTSNWQTVMSLADRRAPRVGKLTIEEGELFQQVQRLCPQQGNQTPSSM